MPLVAYDPNDAAQNNLVGSILASGITEGAAPTSFSSSLNDVASAHGLNLSNTNDQAAAIWYNAQQDFATNTGGSLETALDQNNYAAVQSGLSSDLPTVNGSSGAPQGLAASLVSGIGNAILGTIDPGAVASNAMTAAGIAPQATTFSGAIENWLTRGGLIVIGGIVLIVALWLLLSDQGILPSPSSTAAAIAAA